MLPGFHLSCRRGHVSAYFPVRWNSLLGFVCLAVGWDWFPQLIDVQPGTLAMECGHDAACHIYGLAVGSLWLYQSHVEALGHHAHWAPLPERVSNSGLRTWNVISGLADTVLDPQWGDVLPAGYGCTVPLPLLGDKKHEVPQFCPALEKVLFIRSMSQRRLLQLHTRTQIKHSIRLSEITFQVRGLLF